ncbi:MAG: hypothetical protein ACFE0Q_12010 [Anaerolineae bacterium]
MSDSTTYKTSDSTPFKQDSLRSILSLHMSIVKAIWRKHGSDKLYRYFDLHGGYGVDENGNAGSPLIFHEVATGLEVPYRATIFEKDQDAFNSLKQNVDALNNSNFELINQDHNIYVEKNFEDLKIPEKIRKYQYGVVYSDPSNADPSFDVLRTITTAYPRVDIVINLAAASYKRSKNLDRYENLKDALFAIKKTWIIRKPKDKHQWTMMLGSNWKEFPQWQKRGFVRFDSDLGKEWFVKVAYTEQERHEMFNPKLFDLND